MKITMEQPNAPQSGRKAGKKNLRLKNNQSVSSRESHDFSHGRDRLDFRKRPSGEMVFFVL